MSRCALTRRAAVLITCSKCDREQSRIASIEGWLVLSWLVHVSRSSCKGTSGHLHIMGLNTMIFAVLKAWLMSPLHCVINWKVFYIDFCCFLIIPNVIVLQCRFIFAQIFGCHGNSLWSLEIQIAYWIRRLQNHSNSRENVSISYTEPKSVQFCLFLIKFSCHGNSLSFLENS